MCVAGKEESDIARLCDQCITDGLTDGLPCESARESIDRLFECAGYVLRRYTPGIDTHTTPRREYAKRNSLSATFIYPDGIDERLPGTFKITLLERDVQVFEQALVCAHANANEGLLINGLVGTGTGIVLGAAELVACALTDASPRVYALGFLGLVVLPIVGGIGAARHSRRSRHDAVVEGRVALTPYLVGGKHARQPYDQIIIGDALRSSS
jgi:hypothetical protein